MLGGEACQASLGVFACLSGISPGRAAPQTHPGWVFVGEHAFVSTCWSYARIRPPGVHTPVATYGLVCWYKSRQPFPFFRATSTYHPPPHTHTHTHTQRERERERPHAALTFLSKLSLASHCALAPMRSLARLFLACSASLAALLQAFQEPQEGEGVGVGGRRGRKSLTRRGRESVAEFRASAFAPWIGIEQGHMHLIDPSRLSCMPSQN